ncbi:hypothetical protein [Sulfurimonas sp.]
MKTIIFLLLIISLAMSSSAEQNIFLNKIADAANRKAQRDKDLQTTKLRVCEVRVEDNNTLEIDLKVYFPNLKIKEKFEYVNYKSMQQKFCKDKYFKRMEDGLKIKFNYFNHKNILITEFSLDEKACEKCNYDLNNINQKYQKHYSRKKTL